MTVRRARFRCSVDGTFYYPLDAVLDLPPGEVTVSLARRALRLATHMGFSDLQEELLYQHDVRLSDTVLNRLMRQVGGVAEHDRKEVVEVLQALPEGVAREEHALSQPAITRPKRLYISCDGVMYPTRYRQVEGDRKRIVYQEMKCGTVFWQEGNRTWHKRVISSRDDVQGFGAGLWGLAVRCGMLQSDEVVFISDGGGWCDTVARTYFHDAERILDWYHLAEHVWEAARGLYRDEPDAKKWASRCTGLLRESSGIGLLRYLERCRRSHASKPGGSAGLDALDGLIAYLRPRVAITDYVDYRARGLVIGSGIMESTCKQLVGQRLKGSGRQWSEDGAVAMTALIGKRINGSWEVFWASRPVHRAA
ncbi:MAG: hypothetical protein KJ749_03725 [Planctomycetes bacterium]|nr:hypothetical protein [Planctomycetota bacterium]